MRAAKAIVAAVGSLVTVLTGALADDVLGTDEIGTVVSTAVVAVITVAGVYATPNSTE
jgi:hypothetical protein